MTAGQQISVREACRDDVPAIARLIEPFVAQRMLLARTNAELVELVGNGFVAQANGSVVGFAAVEIYSPKLAELLCLAVAAQCHGQGVGKRLVRRCVECAKQHKVRELMAITSADRFFEDCGFDYTLPGERRAVFIPTRGP